MKVQSIALAALVLVGCSQEEIQRLVKKNEDTARAWANKMEIKVDGLSCASDGACSLKGGDELLKLQCTSYDGSCTITEKVTWNH